MRIAFTFLALTTTVMSLSGCLNTHGNRREGRPMVTRVEELSHAVGKQVTLVGTARTGGPDGAVIELMGGSTELPAYAWPADYVGHRVTVTGTVIDSRDDADTGKRVYRLGEIESTSRWSR
jgi:hypothetical protein